VLANIASWFLEEDKASLKERFCDPSHWAKYKSCQQIKTA